MTEDNLIVLKSAYAKTPIEYKITPCAMKNGMMPSCVRKVDANGDLILSEKDKLEYTKGTAVFIGENEAIVVKHNSTFDLTDPLQAAQWECIKNSKLIAKERTEKDGNGALVIDGGRPIVDQYQNAKGRYGLAELYIERPGKTAQYKNDIRKLILKAQNLVDQDSQSHRVLICKLFEKNMENAHPSDVEDYLMTQAEKYPEKVIKYYNTEEASYRLLLIMAREKNIVTQKQDGLYYADIKLGSNLDIAVEMLKHNTEVRDSIKAEAYPELQKKTTKSNKESKEE